MDFSLLMSAFRKELIWNMSVTHQNTGGFHLTALLGELLADQTGHKEIDVTGESFDATVTAGDEWLEKLLQEGRAVAQRDLDRLTAALDGERG